MPMIQVGEKLMDIFEGLEATLSCGSDSYPAKVVSFKETKSVLTLEFQQYAYHADSRCKHWKLFQPPYKQDEPVGEWLLCDGTKDGKVCPKCNGTKEVKLQMGHQEWIVDWDKPHVRDNTVVRFKKATGKPMGRQTFTKFTLGSARPYYCWEF